MPLTKKERAKAARLYALAVLAHQDDAAADDDEQASIVQTARHAAQAGLEVLGLTRRSSYISPTASEPSAIRRKTAWMPIMPSTPAAIRARKGP